MDPTRIIQELCERYGVAEDFGMRLRPLVERASRSTPEQKRRIMELVRRSFLEEARRSSQTVGESLPKEELRVLSTVAGILHSWDPPEWLKHWGDLKRR